MLNIRGKNYWGIESLSTDLNNLNRCVIGQDRSQYQSRGSQRRIKRAEYGKHRAW